MKRTITDIIIARGADAAPYLIAIPMAIFGIQHFIYLQFVANFIPAWIPGRVFWSCFTGAALIAAATGIVLRILDRWAATWLGIMIFLWVILLHTSRIAQNPAEFAEWRGIFQALAMSGCAFALARLLVGKRPPSSIPPAWLSRFVDNLSESGGSLAAGFLGVSMVALGVEHFIFTETTTPQVPVWIPGNPVGNRLCGATLVALGLGICLPRTRRTSSMLLGILLLLSTALLHLPVVLASSRFESDWTKTLILAGGSFLLARLNSERSVQAC